MKFINDDFLLTTQTARNLYHNYVKDMPIIDYHCHLSPKEIAEDRKFENITQIWLGGDHYKWRLMRNCGVAEEYITGKASDKDKFLCWARVLRQCVGNPLYHWSMLELARYFGWEEPLTEINAETAWNHCNAVIAKEKLSAQELIRRSNVQIICTTDNPEDDLWYHKRIRKEGKLRTSVLPAFRPDKACKINEDGFREYMEVLGKRFGYRIASYKDLLEVLQMSVEYFDKMGCRVSDHGLDFVPCRQESVDGIERIFAKRMAGEMLSEEETESYMTRFLTDMAQEYKKRDWVMQLHYGAERNNNGPMYEKIGPDTGYDCISGRKAGEYLAGFLSLLEDRHMLPKMIIYSLEPADNAMIDTVCGCFHEDGIKGKIQHGSAWWFNDHFKGMREQLVSLASRSVLGNFVGMLTDSRSFLSYTRHEYFRRILCDLLGQWVEKEYYPADMDVLGKIVCDISYYNALVFFQFARKDGSDR